jgi:hypothetical protein
MIRFVYDRPDIHAPFSAMKRVDFHIDDEASLDDMLDVYRDFLRAVGYGIEPGQYIDIVSDDDVQTDDVQEPMGQQDSSSTVLPYVDEVRDILP